MSCRSCASGNSLLSVCGVEGTWVSEHKLTKVVALVGYWFCYSWSDRCWCISPCSSRICPLVESSNNTLAAPQKEKSPWTSFTTDNINSVSWEHWKKIRLVIKYSCVLCCHCIQTTRFRWYITINLWKSYLFYSVTFCYLLTCVIVFIIPRQLIAPKQLEMSYTALPKLLQIRSKSSWKK